MRRQQKKKRGGQVRPARPLPLAPGQELALRFRAALMAADVDQAKRKAIEVEPIRGTGPDPAPLRDWWRGLDRASRQRLVRKLALPGGEDFLKSARIAWEKEQMEARRQKKIRAPDSREGKKEPGTARAIMAGPSPEFTGRIKIWQAEKGFGFIARKGGPDVFCHVTSLTDRESVPEKGQHVRYQLEPSTKKPGTMAAVNVRLEAGNPASGQKNSETKSPAGKTSDSPVAGLYDDGQGEGMT